MLIRRPAVPESAVTDEHLLASRRGFLRTAAQLAVGVSALRRYGESVAAQTELSSVPSGLFSTAEPPTSLDAITHYNNFYEFGPEKGDPSRYARALKTSPWTVRVEGQVDAATANYHVDDLVQMSRLEERIYRLRCVEGWSMVIPWIGVPLADVIRRLRPTSRATFVAFETASRPGEMPGLSSPILAWPYVEALRLDEAMHPLTFLAVGMYGRTLLNQNGAPIRLVVPWKYGFKSIKSIVKIRFLSHQPATSWNRAVPSDFGFYANVNPNVSRPRDQRTERRIGNFFQQRTQIFNGYGDQVAGLYQGQDLIRDF